VDAAVTRAAVRHLRQADPVLAGIIATVGPCRIGAPDRSTHFAALLRSIVYQQLSGRAAATILGRVHGLYGDRAPSPGELLETPESALRGVGLSQQKVSYARDLAGRVADGRLPVHRLGRLPDDEVIAVLTEVKGIGTWTAQMYLMFRLRRPDVLPTLDLGIQKAVQRGWNLRRLPSPEKVERLGSPWAPYRSIAAWYLWRSLDQA
jgi:DNA-3-methyladenine glycosylase II